MTTFSRPVESPVHSFQFKKIELDEAYENSDLSYKTHLQLDEQFKAFQQANFMLNVSNFEFAPVDDVEDLTLVITCTAFGQAKFKTHELKFGDWLVVEPMILPAVGYVMKDQEFRDEYGRYIPVAENSAISE